MSSILAAVMPFNYLRDAKNKSLGNSEFLIGRWASLCMYVSILDILFSITRLFSIKK